MKTFSQYTFLVTAFVGLGLASFCQPGNLDKSIMIGGFQTSVFYSNQFNLLGVSSAKDSIQNLVVKSSQGDLENVDSGIVNGFLRLSNLKNGKVTISAFSKHDTGLHLLNYRTFSVITKQLTPDEIKIKKLKVKPEIKLEGFSLGTLSLHDIKNATKFHINKPYKIKAVTVYFSSYTGICSQPIITNLISDNFDDNFKNIWKRLSVGSYIQLELIDITGEKGNEYRMNPISFRIAHE